jgi:nicotinamidase/pyrazinamidase
MYDTILVDIDTQIDFLFPAGSLYAPGAEKIIPALAKLHAGAKSGGIPVISSADAHSEQDPEFHAWPPHCIAGALGQKKVPETVMAGAITIPNSPDALPSGWQSAPQVIVEKQTVNVFDTATIDRVLEAWSARRYVVCGVVTEVCVLNAVQGLLRGGRKVELVTVAIAPLEAVSGRKAIERMTAAGARLTTVAAIT